MGIGTVIDPDGNPISGERGVFTSPYSIHVLMTEKESTSSTRHPALQDLSRDHHKALTQAVRLMNGGLKGEEDVSDEELASAFLEFWDDHSSWHFREEEEVLLPIYFRYVDIEEEDHIQEMLEDHAWFRDQVPELRRLLEEGKEMRSFLERLGKRLQKHARLEERTIFEEMENTFSPSDLDEIHRRSRAFRKRFREQNGDAGDTGNESQEKEEEDSTPLHLLSEDHNRILAQVRKLSKKVSGEDELLERAREFVEFWEVQLNPHFRLEEDVVLAVSGQFMNVEENPSFQKLVKDHREIRQTVSTLEEQLNKNNVEEGLLEQVGEQIQEHVLFEEEELLPEIRERLTREQLDELEEECSSFRDRHYPPGSEESLQPLSPEHNR